MDLGLTGKTAIVTGAGKGIGRAIAVALAGEGVKIVAIGREREPLDELCSELGGKNTFVSLDLLDHSALTSFLNRIGDEFEPNIVVHNVGGSLGLSEPLVSSADWAKVWQLNLGSAIDINRVCLPKMVTAGWGRIVHLSSASAKTGHGHPAYVSAKLAVEGYVKSMSRVYASANVILSAVAPGAIDVAGKYLSKLSREDPSKLNEYLKRHQASARLGSTAEVASAVTFLCSQQASFAAGAVFGVDGGSS